MWKLIKQFLPNLKSRKTRVAATTAIAAVVARMGFEVETDVIFAIVTLGGLIMGSIAVEDHGRHLASGGRGLVPPGGNGTKSQTGKLDKLASAVASGNNGTAR
jgi:hypothetical protein